MSAYDALLIAVSVVGAFNAVLLVLLWFMNSKPGVLRQYWPYPVLLSLVGLVVVLIGGEHAGVFRRMTGLEILLGAAAGPILVDAVKRSLCEKLSVWIYFAVPGFALCAVTLDRTLNIEAMHAIVTVQVSFTIWAGIEWARDQSRLHSKQPALVLIGAFTVLHIAQGLRIINPDLFRDLIPILLAILLASTTSYLLLRSQTLRVWFRDTGPNLKEADTITRTKAWLIESRAFLSSDLRLADVAGAIGMPGDLLSRRLNNLGQPFTDLVTELRLEEAASRLRSKNDSKASIESIGLLSGYASRSGFYKAFNQKYKLTPAAYRKQYQD